MIAVLDEVQILDEKVVPPGPVPEKSADFLQRLGIELPSLGKGTRPLAGADMARGSIWATILRYLVVHSSDSSEPFTDCQASAGHIFVMCRPGGSRR